MPVPLSMNHNVPQAITEGLRLRGVVVTTAFEDGTHQLDDPALLDRAGAIQRPLFTMDRDLLHEASRRQRAEIPFAGVIYAHQRRCPIGRCIRDLELIAMTSEPRDLLDQILYLPL